MAKKKFRFRWYHLVIALVVVMGTLWVISSSKERPAEVTSEKATKRSILQTVSASGKIQSEVEVKISPEVSGEIIELNVKEGDSVKKNQLLLVIKPDLLQSSQDRNIANLNSAQANISSAKAAVAQLQARFDQEIKLNYNRSKSLHDKKVISDAEWEQIQSSYAAALEELNAAKAREDAAVYSYRAALATVSEGQNSLERTRIYAPMDGIISKLSYKKGEKVVGTAQMAGSEILRIADLSSMQLTVEVGENDILKVAHNDTAVIEIDAYQGRKFKGIVYEIANSPISSATGTSSTDVTNFEVKIRLFPDSYRDLLAKGGQPFRPGMNGNADIQTERKSGVISVPIEGVTLRDKEDSSGKAVEKSSTDSLESRTECVFVISNGAVKLQYVTIGIQDNKYIEILSGLKEGDEIVTGPFAVVSRTLKDGDKVVVNQKAFDSKKLLKKKKE